LLKPIILGLKMVSERHTELAKHVQVVREVRRRIFQAVAPMQAGTSRSLRHEHAQ
jgi:hypothetical protein